MKNNVPKTVSIITQILNSTILDRDIQVDFYVPDNAPLNDQYRLLLINDGQDLPTMNFKFILEQFYNTEISAPLICIGIYCGPDRKNEYGTANKLDYKGRGNKAPLYTQMIFEELMPFIRTHSGIVSFVDKSFCGFSLGGLSALDIVWNHPEHFLNVGVFSGSLWWRDTCQDDESFNESEHRIMHNQVKKGSLHPWLRFFFETGTLDEVADRNGNGIIDAIDDTLSLIDDLISVGYPKENIKYLELENGTHNVETWGKAFPEFLKWSFASSIIN